MSYREDTINCELCKFQGPMEQHDCVGRRIETAVKSERKRIATAIREVLQPRPGFFGGPVYELHGHHLRQIADLLDKD